MVMHLDRPIRLIPPPINQGFANDAPGLEPPSYLYPNGSIAFTNPDMHAQLGHWHDGVDYGVPCGTPIYASADGHVVLTGFSATGFGLRLGIDHGPVWTLCCHLTDILVPLGATVKRGQLVAHSGGGNGDLRDGNSTGCHLHWSVVNPYTWHYLDPAKFVFAP